MIGQSIVYSVSAAPCPGPQGSMTAPATLAIDASPSQQELIDRRLRRAIVEGALRPGTRLVETEFARRPPIDL